MWNAKELGEEICLYQFNTNGNWSHDKKYNDGEYKLYTAAGILCSQADRITTMKTRCGVRLLRKRWRNMVCRQERSASFAAISTLQRASAICRNEWSKAGSFRGLSYAQMIILPRLCVTGFVQCLEGR